MTLDEAIKHAEEIAEENEKFCYKKGGKGGYFNEDTDWNNAKCAAEHRQLAEWLKELKDYRERIPSYEAGYNDAKREIALSGEYERAYERGKADAQPKTGHWIEGKYRDDDIRYNDSSYKCDKCGRIVDFKENYCPNCRSKMVESQESEEQ